MGFRATGAKETKRDTSIMIKTIQERFFESAEIIKKSSALSENIEKAVIALCDCVREGHKIYLFGNGGSAADAQHIAAELIGRYNMERKSIPAISLTTDTSIITAIGNDYSFDTCFSRQCEGLINKGDIVIAISTSGNSKNIIEGLISAKKRGAKTIGLLGNRGGKMVELIDMPIVVESSSTPRIQEVHRVIYHIISELVEKELTSQQ